MKKIILLSIIGLFIFGCSDNEIDSNQVIGKWKLMKAEFNFSSKGKTTIDFSSKSITYNFKPNEKLTISGKGNSIHNEGEYDYFFGEDYLSTKTDPKVLLVKIKDTKWTYTPKGENMILGRSYIDGPNLIFKKITD